MIGAALQPLTTPTPTVSGELCMSSQDRTGTTVIQLKGQIADADRDARAAEEQQRARLFAFAEFRNELFVFEMDLFRGTAILTDGLLAKMARVVTEFQDIRESMADRTPVDGAAAGSTQYKIPAAATQEGSRGT